ALHEHEGDGYRSLFRRLRSRLAAGSRSHDRRRGHEELRYGPQSLLLDADGQRSPGRLPRHRPQGLAGPPDAVSSNAHSTLNASSTGMRIAFISALFSVARPITASNSPYCSAVMPF